MAIERTNKQHADDAPFLGKSHLVVLSSEVLHEAVLAEVFRPEEILV
jgi:hypothetical protein